jgi:hypothetical protein
MMPEVFQRRLIMLFCIRCQQPKIQEEHLEYQLRIKPEDVKETKEVFIKNGFIDADWNILNWEKRQFSSDSSTARVRKFRENAKRFSNDEWNSDETLQ